MLKHFKYILSGDILDRIPHSLSDDSEGRRNRLRQLLELLPIEVQVKIRNIQDWEGHLTITWKFSAKKIHRELIEVLWVYLFAQGDDSVTHEGSPAKIEKDDENIGDHF